MSATDTQMLQQRPPICQPRRARAAARRASAAASGQKRRHCRGVSCASRRDNMPVRLAEPVNDPKAAAFADLLDHLDDEAGAPHANEAGAQKAAERFRAEAWHDRPPLGGLKMRQTLAPLTVWKWRHRTSKWIWGRMQAVMMRFCWKKKNMVRQMKRTLTTVISISILMKNRAG